MPQAGPFHGAGLELLRASVSLLPVPASVVDLETNRIVALNPQFAESLHLPLESILDRTPDELGFSSNNDDRKAVLDGTADGNIHHTHRRTRLPDGNWVEYTDSSRRILVEGKECLFSCYEPASRMVLEKELELERSEANYRLLAENSTDVIARIGMDGKRLYTSPSVYQLSGWSPEELLGQSAFELFHPDDIPALTGVLQRLMSAGRPECPTYRSRTRAGDYIWVETNCTPVKDSEGRIVEIQTSTRDVTSRVEIERTLSEREERLRLVLDATSDGVFDWDVASGKVYFSPAYFTMLGYEPFEFPSNFDAWRERVHPDDISTVEPAIKRHFSNQSGAPYLVEFRMKHKEGRWIWIQAKGKVVGSDPDGNPLRMVGTHTDITERKNQENALREREEQLRIMAENSTDMISRHAPDGRFLYVSTACRKLTGRDPAEILGRDAFFMVHDDDRPTMVSKLGEVVDSSTSVRLEYRLVRADGSTIWCESIAQSIRDPRDGRIKELQSSTRDISDRKRSEETLRRSEEQLRIVADMSLDMLSRHDLAGICHWASPACRQILHIEPVEVVGRNAFDFIVADDRADVQAALARLFETGRSRLQYRILRTDETIIWVETLWSLSRDDAGNPLEIHCSTRDITESREADRKIQALGIFNQTLLDTSGGLIVVLDLHGNVVRFNTACEELTGWKESEVLGRPFFDIFVPPEQRDAVRQVFQKLSAGDFPSRYENDWIARDGTRRWIAWANSAILDDTGNVNFVVGTGLDRTQQRRAEREILELNESLERRVSERTVELQAALKELESFSYSISHDLRSPLRAIDGFSKALIEDAGPNLPSDLLMYLDRIRAASQHMGHLIDDLLRLSRSTRAEIVRQDIDISTMASHIMDDLARQSPERVFVLRIQSEIVIQGDSALVRAVLENLLGNAWKYSSLKSESVIELSSEIRDNGIGFDMAHANKLFGTFHRLHSLEQFEGTGIGLATVRKIVERHGGSVTGSGIPEKGAIFRFTLDPMQGATA